MKKILICVAASVVAITLAGCSSADSKDKKFHEKHYVNIKPTARDATTSNDPERVAGAAIEAADYHHVLAKHRVEQLPDDAFDGAAKILEKSTPADKAQLEPIGTIHSYSVYEMQRWNRYCGKGGKMDKRDWEFITREGKKNLPDELIGDCKAPTFTQSEYLNAWDTYCKKNQLTESERRITLATHSPGKCK